MAPTALPGPVRLAILLCLAALAAGSPARSEEATLNLEVAGGRWKSIRLNNLPKGAMVGVEMTTDGPVTVSMVDQSDHRRAPSFSQPLFSSRVEAKLSFSVTAPRDGHYFVVFDNRLAAVPRSINVTIRAARGRAAADDTVVKGVLARFQQQLQTIFTFEPFPIQLKRCEVETAPIHDDGIMLCAEYVRKLYELLGDKSKTSDAILFTLFHEVGHVLLKQWEYPFYEDEEVADEFATAMMVMLNQKDRVPAKAEFVLANPSLAEALAQSVEDDRSPFSVQRAQNILRWANDPNLVHRWQAVFVPHMQTPILQKMQRKPPAWADREAVEAELKRRELMRPL